MPELSCCLISANFYIRQKELPYRRQHCLVDFHLVHEVIKKLVGVALGHLLRPFIGRLGAPEGLELLADVGKKLCIGWLGVGHFIKRNNKNVENPGIDPGASRMLSGRSTI